MNVHPKTGKILPVFGFYSNTKRYAEAMERLQVTGNRRNAQNNNEQMKAPIVVLNFDDAEICHYTIVAPLLKKLPF